MGQECTVNLEKTERETSPNVSRRVGRLWLLTMGRGRWILYPYLWELSTKERNSVWFPWVTLKKFFGRLNRLRFTVSSRSGRVNPIPEWSKTSLSFTLGLLSLPNVIPSNGCRRRTFLNPFKSSDPSATLIAKHVSQSFYDTYEIIITTEKVFKYGVRPRRRRQDERRRESHLQLPPHQGFLTFSPSLIELCVDKPTDSDSALIFFLRKEPD